MKATRLKKAISMIATVVYFTFGVQQAIYAEDLQQQNKDAKKTISKEVKRLQKEGYAVQDGSLSLETQIENLWRKQVEVDNDGIPVYCIITQNATAESIPMASTKAHGLAKEQLATQIQVRILKMVDDKVAKNEFQQEMASKIVNMVNANGYIIMATLGQAMPIVQVYRSLPEKNIEVVLSFAYNSRVITNAAIRAVRDNLGDSSNDLIGMLDNLMK